MHLDETLPYVIKHKLLNSQQGHWDESFCVIRPQLALLYEQLFDLEMFSLQNHFNNQMCPLRWKVQNPFHVTSRIRPKLAACERRRRGDTGMSNFCGPTTAQVYLNLPLEMRILQRLWSWDFTRFGVPSWPTEQRNPLMSISVSVPSRSAFIKKKRKFNRHNQMALRTLSFAHSPLFFYQNVTQFLNRQMIPLLWPGAQ